MVTIENEKRAFKELLTIKPKLCVNIKNYELEA